jgi:sugar phosphate permease
MEAGGVLTPVMGYFIDYFGFYTNFTVAGIVVVVVTLICWVFLRGRQD